MEHLRADLQLALFHLREVEQRIDEQQAKIAELRAAGAPIVEVEDLLAALTETCERLKQHLALVTGPSPADMPADMRN